MKAQTHPGTIVSRYEVASIVGVTRQGVASVIDHPDFPAPICTIGKNGAPLFWRAKVEKFAADRKAAAASQAPEPAAA